MNGYEFSTPAFLFPAATLGEFHKASRASRAAASGGDDRGKAGFEFLGHIGVLRDEVGFFSGIFAQIKELKLWLGRALERLFDDFVVGGPGIIPDELPVALEEAKVAGAAVVLGEDVVAE
jgi:hypothetical protein